MIRSTGFTNCCTANTLYGFFSDYSHKLADEEDKKKLLQEYNEMLEKHEQQSKREGNAVVVAITTEKQKVASKILRERGYSHSKWMSSKKYTHKIRLWYLPVQD